MRVSHGHFGGSNGQYSGQISSQFPKTTVAPPYTPLVANMISHGGHQGIQNAISEHSFAVNPNWYFDSGASAHVKNELANLQIHQPSYAGEGVVGNGTSLLVPYTAKGLLRTPHINFKLNHILHSPAITHNLLSVH